MTSRPIVVAWKYNSAPGIRFREHPQTGKMEIFNWPSVLGSKPTETQMLQWEQDYAAQVNENAIQADADIDASMGLLGLIRLLGDPSFTFANKTEAQIRTAIKAKV